MNYCRKSFLNGPLLTALIGLLLFSSCSPKFSNGLAEKFSPDQLKEDLTVLETTYKEAHPSLYWYTPKDSIDQYFEKARAAVKDSMNEAEFYRLIAYTISPIHCGHTSVKYSKPTTQYLQNDRRPHLPVEVRYVGDTALITAVYRRTDSMLKYGMQLKSVNRIPATTIRDSIFRFISSDGFNTTVKYTRMNGNFSAWHRLIYGLYDKYEFIYVDSAGNDRTIVLPLYEPLKDTLRRRFVRAGAPAAPAPQVNAAERLRRLIIDSSNNSALMLINSFENKAHLVGFFKSSFRQLRKEGIKNLVIDIRNNGGGNISRSALLGKFIADKPFKVCDTAFSVKRGGFTYGGYIQHKFFYSLMMKLFTHKKKDGKYHFNYLERHFYKPKKRNHFNGDVYVLTAGNTFSASTLFINHVQHQQNVKIIGDETGGGYYGSTAINIPDLTLPNSRIRVRLPLYRLVIDKDRLKTGRGFFPDYNVSVTTESLRKRYDIKMEFVKKLIAEKKQ